MAMFILHSPTEKISAEVTGATMPLVVALSYVDEKYSGGNVVSAAFAVAGANSHTEIPTGPPVEILAGPSAITGRPRRTVVSAIFHNRGATPATLSLYIENASPQLRFLKRIIQPDQALVYGEGGWELVPDLALLTLPGLIQPFGVENVVATADTRFLYPGFGTGQAEALPVGMLCPRDATITEMFARHNRANGNGNPVTYRLRVNGFDTQLSTTLPTGVVGNATDADPAHEVVVARGDLLEVTAVKPSPLGNGLVMPTVTLLLRS